jgi:hypothetical protein
VSDGVLTVTQTFVVAVGSPLPPTLDAPASLSLLEDAPEQTVRLSGISAGPGNPNTGLVVTATSGNPAVVPNPVVTYGSPDSAGVLSLKPAANASGTAVINVRVQAPTGAVVSRNFTVNVTGVNDAPSFTKGADQAVPAMRNGRRWRGGRAGSAPAPARSPARC